MYQKLCPGKRIPKPRYAALRSLHEPNLQATSSGELLDAGALVLYFPHPKTATGEDILELHVHGGPAVVRAVLAAISKCATPERPVRYAEPGEFTRRAFMNDRLDLTQVEALGDTLSAVTEEQRRLSVQGTTSGLSTRYDSWRQALLNARGEMEALIDFSEDQHFDESPAELALNVAGQVEELLRIVKLHSANAMRGELLRNGISISLIGAPNVGKSSLLNQIVGRNAAIVSKEAGTTRDIIEVGIDIGGFFCRLGDTAGLRGGSTAADALSSAIGEVEREGIVRAKAKAMSSDVVILLLAVGPSLQNQGYQLHFDAEVIETAQTLMQSGKRVIVGINKMDLFGQESPKMEGHITTSVCQVLPGIARSDVVCMSCTQAEQARTSFSPSDVVEADAGNLQVFLDSLVQTFRDITAAATPDGTDAATDRSIWEESLGASERQRVLLNQCADNLQHFLSVVRLQPPSPSESDAKADIDIVVATESLRTAANCLAKLTGRGDEAGDVEEVLGVVFEK